MLSFIRGIDSFGVYMVCYCDSLLEETTVLEAVWCISVTDDGSN